MIKVDKVLSRAACPECAQAQLSSRRESSNRMAAQPQAANRCQAFLGPGPDYAREPILPVWGGLFCRGGTNHGGQPPLTIMAREFPLLGAGPARTNLTGRGAGHQLPPQSRVPSPGPLLG